MKQFLGDDFLLQSEFARHLYHDFAAKMPIYDYHCHLPVADIEANTRFKNLTDVWLRGDHYKWRAMRANGVDEDFITGRGGDREKFQKWAETVPSTIGNPLYHWTHLELKKPFGIEGILLNGDTAGEVWQRTGDLLATSEFFARGIIAQMDVRVVCTTDDPLDDLSHHQAIAADSSFSTVVVPAFRPDKGIQIENAEVFREWVGRLESIVGHSLSTFDDYLGGLGERIEHFHGCGARVSDHALVAPVYSEASASELEDVYRRVRDGQEAGTAPVEQFQTAVLQFLGREYARRGWTMQLHLSAQRSNSSRGFARLGPDTGFDSIADPPIAAPLNLFLNSLDVTKELPKTIIYSLNAGHNDVIATTIGNFQDGPLPGKMQFGSGWWFNDQKDGMIDQMISLANMGLLSRFVGMLTDSRSFLSYPRHEYFRRIVCQLLGKLVDDGEAPNDIGLLGGMVEDICWNNAVNYFGIELPEEGE